MHTEQARETVAKRSVIGQGIKKKIKSFISTLNYWLFISQQKISHSGVQCLCLPLSIRHFAAEKTPQTHAIVLVSFSMTEHTKYIRA